ncbi:hypothetical protein BJ170DRAFT_591940 [Xylariales sp. AK1849]|nr:hypothetical protein BJ170DRAFT_591940 [Xylariales sp. AK1849]
MPKRATKSELQQEAERLRKWTYNRHESFELDKINELDFEISSDARKCIQSWIDVDSAWCTFFTPANADFFKATAMVAERTKDLVPRNRVVFFCLDYASFRRETDINQRGEVGKEIGALALLYSAICQMVDALPDGEDGRFDGGILSHMKWIDGTSGSLGEALGALSHLLAVLGNGVLIMVDSIDRLYLDEVSGNIVSAFIGLIGGARNKARVWIGHTKPGECVYRGRGVEKKFSLKPGFLGSKHSLRELDFPGWKS